MRGFVTYAFIVLRGGCPKPGHQARLCRRGMKNDLWSKEFKIYSLVVFFNALEPRLSAFCVGSGVLPVKTSE